jgi:hypothetical protein
MMVGEIHWVVDHKQPTPSTNNAVCSLNSDNVGFQPPLKGGGGQASQKGLGRVVIYSDLRRGRPEGGQ